MQRVSQHGVGVLARTLIPTIIHVRIPKLMRDEDLPVMRRFLKILREVQQSYFVRFAMDLLWVMESDGSDAFYARDNTSSQHKDVTFDVQVRSSKHVEIKVRIPWATKQHLVIKELSRILGPSVTAPTTEDDDAYYETMTKFHTGTNMFSMLNYLNDDFHIVFIPNKGRQSYYPIPLFGLSVGDAKRRFLASEKSFDFLQLKYQEILEEKPVIGETWIHLVESIQDNEAMGERCAVARTTYALAELLFGYYISRQEGVDDGVSPHELILFDNVADEDSNIIEVYNLHMKDLSH